MWFRFGLSIGLALGLGACQTNLSDVDASATRSRVTTIAFEGFVDVPQPVGEAIAGELVRAEAAKHFVLVAATDREARYTMRGFLAPQAQGGTTAVSYVWDLYDRAGHRAHRLQGETRLPGASADPWAALQGTGGRTVAEESAEAINRFLMTPEPATLSTNTVAVAPAVVEARAEVASIDPLAMQQAQASEPAPRPIGRRVLVDRAEGLDDQAATKLQATMKKALAELGYALVDQPTMADIRLKAEATLNPPDGGRQLIAIIWRVADGAGRDLGEVRQLARVPQGGLDQRGTLAKAVEQALPNLVALAPPRVEMSRR